MGMVEGEEFATELTKYPEGLEEVARVCLVRRGTGQGVGQRKEVRDDTLAAVDAPGEQTTTFLGQSPSSMIHQLGKERFGDQQLIKRLMDSGTYHRPRKRFLGQERTKPGMPEWAASVIIS